MVMNLFCNCSVYWKHQISLLNISAERVLKSVFILAIDKVYYFI